ncbi:MAG: glycosyltransferase 87 family protein, partial [Pseudomonadota bacterium]
LDQIIFLQPWLDSIQASDGLAIFATPFTNYTGGYVGVLWGWSLAGPLLSDQAILKLASLTGTALLALSAGLLLRRAGLPRWESLFGGLLTLALPSVMMNGASHAQADAFYTAFCLLCLAALMADRRVLAGVAFCAALSFKLQAIFLAPFLAGVMLRDWRAVALSALALIPTYLVVNGLYVAAGRPVIDVLMIYGTQADTYREISMNAANPWFLIQTVLSEDAHDAAYREMVLVGLALASVAGLAIPMATLRARPTEPSDLLFWAATSALAMPFLLPKMHDRYFFLGEVLLLLLALTDRRFWPAALLAQVSAVFIYAIYFDVTGLSTVLSDPALGTVGVTFMGLTLMSFARARKGGARAEGDAHPSPA